MIIVVASWCLIIPASRLKSPVTDEDNSLQFRSHHFGTNLCGYSKPHAECRSRQVDLLNTWWWTGPEKQKRVPWQVVCPLRSLQSAGGSDFDAKEEIELFVYAGIVTNPQTKDQSLQRKQECFRYRESTHPHVRNSLYAVFSMWQEARAKIQETLPCSRERSKGA